MGHKMAKGGKENSAAVVKVDNMKMTSPTCNFVQGFHHLTDNSFHQNCFPFIYLVNFLLEKNITLDHESYFKKQESWGPKFLNWIQS